MDVHKLQMNKINELIKAQADHYPAATNEAKQEYLELHCEHSEALYDDLEECPVCHIDMAEYYAERAEDLLDGEIKDAYYGQKYGV